MEVFPPRPAPQPNLDDYSLSFPPFRQTDRVPDPEPLPPNWLYAAVDLLTPPLRLPSLIHPQRNCTVVRLQDVRQVCQPSHLDDLNPSHGNPLQYADGLGSWVMLHDQEGFVRLPNERLVYSSPPRTSLALTPLPSYKGQETLSVQSSAGCIYLTNQRVRPILRSALIRGTNCIRPDRLPPRSEIQ